MPIHAVIGGQRGDEGKGRFVDLIASNYSIVARGNGGANAGHTIAPEGMDSIALHQIPAGIIYKNTLNIIGNGVFIDPVRLVQEIKTIEKSGLNVNTSNLKISNIAHLVMPHHLLLDKIREQSVNAQGSTKSGIAFVASDKYLRVGSRFEDVYSIGSLKDRALSSLISINEVNDEKQSLSNIKKEIDRWIEALEYLRPFLDDTSKIMNDELIKGKNVLAEGAQAFWLDINHGMYPFVTSSSTTVNGLLDGLGVSSKHLQKVSLVVKAIKSHVGNGPFVTEITDVKLSQNIRGEIGLTDSEYGATTKRPRRIGYPDLVELRKAIEVTGADEIYLSKLDHLPRYGGTVKIAGNYKLDNKMLTHAPSSAKDLEKCKPIYTELPVWQNDIGDIREYSELPNEAKSFIEYFENKLSIPITKIGVGPLRNSVIYR